MLKITSHEPSLSLQSHLDTAFRKEDWLLKFNIDKCLMMHYVFNNKDFPLLINDQELKSTLSLREN